MSGVRLTGDWGKLGRRLATMASPGLFLSVARQIAEYGVSSTKLRFKDQLGPDGKAWIPSQRAEKTGGKTLIDKAVLLNSITGQSDAAKAEWGTNVVYAATHQFGRSIALAVGPGRIVARPFVGINKDDQEEINQIWIQTMAEVGR